MAENQQSDRGLWVAFAAVLAFMGLQKPADSTPAPPPEVVRLDLTAAFSSNPNRAEAVADAKQQARFAGTCKWILEWDGSLADPAFKSDEAIDSMRIIYRNAAWRGGSLAGRYPTLAPAIEAHFLALLGGEKPQELTSERRKLWAQAYGDVEAGCRKAAADLQSK